MSSRRRNNNNYTSHIFDNSTLAYPDDDNSRQQRHEPSAAVQILPPPSHSGIVLDPADIIPDSRNSDYFFDDAFRLSPTPPPPNSFLRDILNPDPNTTDRSSLPFGYTPNSFSTAIPDFQTFSSAAQDPYSWSSAAMPPQRNQPPRPARLPSGYVDLTGDSPPSVRTSARSRQSSPAAGPSTKRIKQNNGLPAVRSTTQNNGLPAVRSATQVEEIDLLDDDFDPWDPVQVQLRAKAAEAAEAAKAPKKPEEQPTNFNTFTCVICMETPENITATLCGHLFCHTCLMEALIAGENRGERGEPKRSQCPVCRKQVSRNKSSDIIPLSLMLKKGLATQPRKSSPANTKKVS